MKNSHAIALYILAVAVAIACVVILAFWSPNAHACGNGHSPYVQRKPDKPVIALDQLTTKQKADLKRFGADFTAAVETISKTVDVKDIDSEEYRQKADAAGKLVRLRLIELGKELTFRTTMTVGNGMLCGARIEIQVPPAEQDIESTSIYSVWVKGKSRTGMAAEGDFSDALREISLLP